MAKKWTKAEREAASIAGKKRWAARRLTATATKYALKVPVTDQRGGSAENDRNVINAALLLNANGALTDKQVVDIVDRVFRS